MPKFAVLRNVYFSDDELTQYFVPVVKLEKDHMLVLDENNLKPVPYAKQVDGPEDEPDGWEEYAQVAVVDRKDWERMVEFHGQGTFLSKRAVAMMDPYREES